MAELIGTLVELSVQMIVLVIESISRMIGVVFEPLDRGAFACGPCSFRGPLTDHAT